MTEHSDNGCAPQAGSRERTRGPNHRGPSSQRKELESDPRCREVIPHPHPHPHEAWTGRTSVAMPQPRWEEATAHLAMLFAPRMLPWLPGAFRTRSGLQDKVWTPAPAHHLGSKHGSRLPAPSAPRSPPSRCLGLNTLHLTPRGLISLSRLTEGSAQVASPPGSLPWCTPDSLVTPVLRLSDAPEHKCPAKPGAPAGRPCLPLPSPSELLPISTWQLMHASHTRKQGSLPCPSPRGGSTGQPITRPGHRLSEVPSASFCSVPAVSRVPA